MILAGGGELLLDEGWLPQGEAARLFLSLVGETPWQQEAVVIAGRHVLQPRLTAWYGDEGASYTYSGLTVHPLPWTEVLGGLRERVQAATGHPFNSVLINHYRDGQDAMGFHSDDEKELGENPVIASLSLGATRRFLLRYRKRDAAVPDVELDLPSGSLLVMGGTTQHFWKHGVPRVAGDVGPRLNLTFRRILHDRPAPPARRRRA